MVQNKPDKHVVLHLEQVIMYGKMLANTQTALSQKRKEWQIWMQHGFARFLQTKDFVAKCPTEFCEAVKRIFDMVRYEQVHFHEQGHHKTYKAKIYIDDEELQYNATTNTRADCHPYRHVTLEWNQEQVLEIRGGFSCIEASTKVLSALKPWIADLPDALFCQVILQCAPFDTQRGALSLSHCHISYY